MKNIIFFDLDNTILSAKTKQVPSETIKLLKELANNPNVELGLATGRGPSKVYLEDNLLDLFKYKIFINGALAYKNDELIYSNPLDVTEIKKVAKLANDKNISIGYVGLENEYVNRVNEDITEGMKDFQHKNPPVDELVYETKPIYQLWLFSQDKQSVDYIMSKTSLLYYPWHSSGADLVDHKTNKANAIKKLLKDEKDYKLIAVGDGNNDIKMIELADIGIAMDNSGFAELKKKADYIAPHIDANQLYNFFKDFNIFSWIYWQLSLNFVLEYKEKCQHYGRLIL